MSDAVILFCTRVKAEDGQPTSEIVDVSLVEAEHTAGLDPDGETFHILAYGVDLDLAG